VSLAHPEASRVSRALVVAGVVPDFRPPNLVRLCPAPAYTRFVDVWDALDRMRRLVASGDHLTLEADPGRVT
jgi:kynureninase